MDYRPHYLPWCHTFEQEVQELRDLIIGCPADVLELRKQYSQLTGKRFRKKKAD